MTTYLDFGYCTYTFLLSIITAKCQIFVNATRIILTHATSHSRSGLDPCLLFATFETMLSQLRSTGEINISSFAKHLSSKHDLALSSVDQYIYLHDTVAAAIGKFIEF